MESLDITLPVPKGRNSVEVKLGSCFHVGHMCHEREQTMQCLDEVLQTPGMFLWMLGDTFDNGTKNSPAASVYENTMNPQEQTIVVASMMRPLVEAYKIPIWHHSNHPWRTFKDTGFWSGEEALVKLFFGNGVSKEDWRLIERYAGGELTAPRYGGKANTKTEVLRHLNAMFDRLRPDPRPKVQWGGWQAISKVHVGKQTYTIHSCHGEGSGTGPTSALGAVHKQSEIAEADLFFRGHHHKRIVSEKMKAYYSPNGKCELKRIGLLTTGCYLGYHGSYGEAAGLPPNATGMTSITLHADKHHFTMHV